MRVGCAPASVARVHRAPDAAQDGDAPDGGDPPRCDGRFETIRTCQSRRLGGMAADGTGALHVTHSRYLVGPDVVAA